MNSSEFNDLVQFVRPGTTTAKPVQKRVDYDSSGNPIYIGFAVQGKASSDASWFIEKLTYDSNGNQTLSQFSARDSIWDNRTSSVTYS